VISNLKKSHDERVAKLRELPDAERTQKQAQIKSEEGPLWQKLFDQEPNEKGKTFIKTDGDAAAEYTKIRNDLETFFGFTLKPLPTK
jgi:hypothetical protein